LPLPTKFVVDRLCREGVEDGQARYWADLAGGSLTLAQDLAAMNIYEEKCQLAEQLSGLSHGTALELAAWLQERAKDYAESYLKQHKDHAQSMATREGQGRWLSMVAHIFTTALRMSAGADPNELPGAGDQAAVLETLARRFGTVGCAEAIRATSRAQGQLEANANPTLTFESLMLNYLGLASRRGHEALRSG
jgi:hypothetical protein